MTLKLKVVETSLYFDLAILYRISACTWAKLLSEREPAMSLLEYTLRENVLVQH